MLQGLMALAGAAGGTGGGGGGGLPGFDNSSSAESSAGPITVGGLTFAPDSTQTLVNGVIVVVAVLAALMLVKKAR